jgi:hypothetical protein
MEVNLFLLIVHLSPQETFRETHNLTDQLISQDDHLVRAMTET